MGIQNCILTFFIFLLLSLQHNEREKNSIKLIEEMAKKMYVIEK